MRALLLTGKDQASVQDVPEPVAGPGQVVIDVRRVGICGTDLAFFRGTMPFLADGRASYPLRPGHEWAGVVASVGDGVDAWWIGRRVTGDTMLGCRACDRCAQGRQHVCARRFEVGVLGGWPGALSEKLLVPATSLFPLPDSVSDAAGALVEPSANALRAVQDAHVTTGQRVLVIGPGTLGLMAVAFAVAAGATVEVIGRSEAGLELATTLGAACTSTGTPNGGNIPGDFPVVIDASGGVDIPSLALDLAAPGGAIVLMGISSEPSMIDTRQAVTNDLTVIGNLSGSPAMAATIEAFATGSVDPTVLIAATVPLEQAPDVFAGWRPPGSRGPKVHFSL